MIKKTISYTSPFDETKVITKDYYFSLTKVEILEFSTRGDDFEERLLRIVAAKDLSAVFTEFRAIIKMALGMKDGDELIKDPVFTGKFLASPAFDQLVQDLFGSDDQGASFFQGMLPKDMQKEAEKQLKTANNQGAPDPFRESPAWLTEGRLPTPQEFAAASPEHQREAAARAFKTQQG